MRKRKKTNQSAASSPIGWISDDVIKSKLIYFSQQFTKVYFTLSQDVSSRDFYCEAMVSHFFQFLSLRMCNIRILFHQLWYMIKLRHLNDKVFLSVLLPSSSFTPRLLMSDEDLRIEIALSYLTRKSFEVFNTSGKTPERKVKSLFHQQRNRERFFLHMLWTLSFYLRRTVINDETFAIFEILFLHISVLLLRPLSSASIAEFISSMMMIM